MTTYSLKCLNDSKTSDGFVIFQKSPAPYAPDNPSALAWFAGPGETGARNTSTWNPDYSFNLAETAPLKPAIPPVSSVKPNQTPVGIGMSGSGTFVVQAHPNITATFTPHPNYWVIFGKFETGEVMDVQDTSDKTP